MLKSQKELEHDIMVLRARITHLLREKFRLQIQAGGRSKKEYKRLVRRINEIQDQIEVLNKEYEKIKATA